MGRRKRGFEWVREDQDDEAVEKVERRNRSADKAHTKRMEAALDKLMALPKGTRAKLPLHPELLAVLDELERSAPTPARRRLTLRALTWLREEDEDQLDAALAGDTPAARRDRAIDRWLNQLLEGDDDARRRLDARVDDHQGLGQALRGTRGEGAGAKRARKRLRAFIASAYDAIAAEADA